MSFRNDQQRGAVCMVLTERLPRGPYWTPDGRGVPRPTDRACAVRDGDTRLCESEALLVRVAWDVWNGSGEASLERILHSFDRANLMMVGSLLVNIAAPSSARVDEWISAYVQRST